jgi:hypothetical protein
MFTHVESASIVRQALYLPLQKIRICNFTKCPAAGNGEVFGSCQILSPGCAFLTFIGKKWGFANNYFLFGKYFFSTLATTT